MTGRRSRPPGRPPRGPGRRDDADQAPVRDLSVGLLERRGRVLVAEPFFERGRRQVVEADRRARPGELVLVRSARQTRGHAKVVRSLGRPDVARDVLEALMLDRGLRRTFPPGLERAAREAVEHVDADAVARRDLRDLPTFTIDPVTARDFDDAISAQDRGGGRITVWVHIADVSAYVTPGSPVDREAYRRATSVYVPSLVEPMLPQVLSNDACSLVPGEDRLAVTVELEVEGDSVVRSSVARSRIRSDERLDYDRVDRLFAGLEEAREPWAAPLAAARAASGALRRRREAAGSLAVSSSEPEFTFDGRGQVVSGAPSEQTESHQLIEHLMIAANEAVAELVSGRGIPALYRVHERPTPEAAERLLAQLASLDVPTPPAPQVMSPSQAADVVAAASVLVADEVRRRGSGGRGLTSLVLRALKQARYDPANLGHAGLHSAAYCHFTSPIRRYPDLVCHRAVLSAVGGGEHAPRRSTLDEAATWTSAREREAMIIERDADDIVRAFLLRRELGDGDWGERAFDGEVVGVIGAGAFVAFGAYQGMLPVRRLRGDWWDLNEEGTVLRGADSGRTLRIGDPVRVAVRGIDEPRGRVDLDLAP